MKNKITLFILFVGVSMFTRAQQVPHFTQYMYNMSVINPAYTTGETENVNLGLIHRQQWTGFKGPETTSLFAHKAFTDKMEAGISYTNDRFSRFVSSNNINADYAYRLNLGKERYLSFGVKLGAVFHSVSLTGANLFQTGAVDPAFAENLSKTFINFGAGLYYNTSKFYLGVSAPNFIKTTHFENASSGDFVGKEEIHTFLTSGYVFDINRDFKLKPAFMAKYVSGAPLSVDVTANVLYNDRFELGIGYRLDESISGLFNVRVTPALRLGYAYDHVTNEISRVALSSHEFILLYDLNLLFNKGYDRSPRFF